MAESLIVCRVLVISRRDLGPPEKEMPLAVADVDGFVARGDISEAMNESRRRDFPGRVFRETSLAECLVQRFAARALCEQQAQESLRGCLGRGHGAVALFFSLSQ